MFFIGANYFKNTDGIIIKHGEEKFIANLSKKIIEKKKYKLSYLRQINLLNFDKKPSKI